ncbi:MAG: hypothetical protein Kow0031_09360 [Anaerolineae bacterium]
MKRYFKLTTIFSLLMLLTVAFAGVASADIIRGKGWLHAEGSGFAKLQMTGQVEINGHGVGAVYIYGAESIRADGDGKRSDLRGGGVVFRGFEGTIHVTGQRMVVKMLGSDIDFTARGKGRAVLRGNGTYETGDGGSGDWQPDGLNIEVVEE